MRAGLRPGDLGEIVRLHGAIYAREHGFDETFEAYVAGPMAEFALRRSPRERIWIAGREGAVEGCAAVVEASAREAQLRWYLVVPEARGRGLGTALLDAAIAFAREQGYASIFLWTVSALEAAARRYGAAGFRKTEARPGRRWGADVVEERYDLDLAPPGRS